MAKLTTIEKVLIALFAIYLINLFAQIIWYNEIQNFVSENKLIFGTSFLLIGSYFLHDSIKEIQKSKQKKFDKSIISWSIFIIYGALLICGIQIRI